MKKLTLLLAFLCSAAHADCTTNMSPMVPITLSYSSTNVTTSAWVQLNASLPAVTRCLSVFDSSGQTMVLGLGQSGHEVAQSWWIFPGGMANLPVTWPLNARLSIEAISGTASSGEIIINLYQ